MIFLFESPGQVADVWLLLPILELHVFHMKAVAGNMVLLKVRHRTLILNSIDLSLFLDPDFSLHRSMPSLLSKLNL
jgi:hypothetical protein